VGTLLMEASVVILFIYFPVPWIFFTTLGVWVGLSGFFYWHLYYAKENFFPDLALLITTELSVIGLLLLIEWPILNWILITLCAGFVVVFFLKSHLKIFNYLMNKTHSKNEDDALFDMYVFTLIFAFDLFFPIYLFGYG
jgi:hypothetical protein